ncbi:cytochrome P450 2K6-like isoform X2 [Ranitomeya imitator]|uniref:cytochrome P450 2K6-like isoform X2 n=1 Tax=Ranitomeya imitator TaxID=111125 RepID=UPI0037E96000
MIELYTEAGGSHSFPLSLHSQETLPGIMIPSDPITLVLSIILCLFFVLFFFGWKKNAYNLPPGPRPLPIIGNLHILDMERPHLTMHELSKKYGPVYTLQIGVEKVVVICGYEAVKDALVNHADEFSGRPKDALVEEVYRGHGLIFASMDNWRAMRRFTLSTLRDFGMGKETIENKISEESDFLVQKFRSYKDEPFDNNMNINAAVANIIISILLSKRFDYEDPTLLKLLKMTKENFELTGSPMAMLYNTYPSVMRWFTSVAEKVVRNINELHIFTRENFINQREQLDVNDQRNLIDSFLVKQREEKPNAKLYFTDENLTMLVADLFEAGMETTSTTLRWGLLLMMKYPEIQKKVQSEIDKVIGSNEPQVIHRKEMPYTDAVIHEIQRFGNIAPNNLPHATTQDVNFRGYLLPKGIQVIPLLTSVLYDKNHFAKADEFYPEHFLDSSGNFVRNEAFLPFSAGKRSCAGENLAKMELYLFFTRLLQNFTFKAPPGATLDLTPAVGLTASPVPYKMCAIPRV